MMRSKHGACCALRELEKTNNLENAAGNMTYKRKCAGRRDDSPRKAFVSDLHGTRPVGSHPPESSNSLVRLDGAMKVVRSRRVENVGRAMDGLLARSISDPN